MGGARRRQGDRGHGSGDGIEGGETWGAGRGVEGGFEVVGGGSIRLNASPELSNITFQTAHNSGEAAAPENR